MSTPANQILALIRQVNSQAELRSLSHEIGRRFRELQPTAHEVASSSGISRGSRVSFLDKGGRRIYGRVEKMNQKTVSVTPDGGAFGAGWRVSPQLLRVEPEAPAVTFP